MLNKNQIENIISETIKELSENKTITSDNLQIIAEVIVTIKIKLLNEIER